MPKYQIYASFSVSMVVDVEADSPEEAALEFGEFPSIPCGVDFELEDSCPTTLIVLDPYTGEELHKERY